MHPVVPLAVDIRARDPIAPGFVGRRRVEQANRSMRDLSTPVSLLLLRQIVEKDVDGWFLMEVGTVTLTKVASMLELPFSRHLDHG